MVASTPMADLMSCDSASLHSRNAIDRDRPSSEPCAVTDLCLSIGTDASNKPFSAFQDDTNDTPMPKDSSSSGATTMQVDKTSVAAAPGGLVLGGSAWRKVEPRRGAAKANVSEQAGIKSVFLSEPALNVTGSGGATFSLWQHSVEKNVAGESNGEQRAQNVVLNAIAGTDNADTSRHNNKEFACLRLPAVCDELETRVDADESSSNHSETGTGYDLTDNNVVTTHQLRDDIPDSELIDYSDDGDESLINSSICTSDAKEREQIFIALFDYDPATMSPNPDAVESELAFSEGHIIKVWFCHDDVS